MKKATWLFMCILLSSLLLFACSSDDSTDGDLDGDIIDGDAADGDATDGDTTDGDTVDGDTTDNDSTDGFSFLADVNEILDTDVDDAYLVDALENQVAVAWDKLGIPHIYAASLKDSVTAMGYIQADMRFFEMDFFRRVGRGKLSGLPLTGLDAMISTDLFLRTIFSTTDGGDLLNQMYDKLDDNTKELLIAYSDGINLRLKRYREDPADWPEAYSFFLVDLSPDMMEDWTPVDTISIARYQTWDLSSQHGPEISRTLMLEMLGEELYNTLIFSEPTKDISILPDSLQSKSGNAKSLNYTKPLKLSAEKRKSLVKLLKSTNEMTENVRKMLPRVDGSNNWVIAPDDNGKSYLANDPHLSLYAPAIFMPFTADVTKMSGDADEVFTGGVAFPGTPAVVIGRNKNLAWGETVVGYDVTDVYLETVTFDSDDKPVSVLFEGNQVPVIEVVNKFMDGNMDKEGTIEKSIFYIPHHGPILPGQMDVDAGTALSIKWTGMLPTKEIQAVVNLQFAKNVDEAFEVLKEFEVGAQNYVLADRNGNIGWDPHALVPKRTCDMSVTPPWMVLPGEGGCEWNGFLTDEELPKAKNPSEGYIITANNDPTGGTVDNDPTNDDNYFLYNSVDPTGYRAYGVHQGLEKLLAEDSFDWEDLMTLQFSYLSYYAKEIVPIITALVDRYTLEANLSTKAKTAFDLLKEWDFQMASGITDPLDPLNSAAESNADLRASSAAATYFSHLMIRLGHDIFMDELELATDNDVPSISSKHRIKALIKIMKAWNDSTAGNEPTILDNVHTDGITEDPGDILAIALESAVDDVLIRDEYKDGDIADAMWGKAHNLIQKHQISGMTSDYNNGPFGLGGGPFTINPANYRPGYYPWNPTDGGQGLTFSSGPAVRFVHEVTNDKIVTHMNFPGGVNERIGQKHYDDLLQLWMSGDMTTLHIKWEDVKADGIEKLTVLSPTK